MRTVRAARHPMPLVLAAAVALSGCGSPPKTSFYTLSARGDNGPPAAALAASSQIGIAVGPVTLPELVDRPQLVVRTGENQVALLDQHRWAESLKREIPRVLAGHLARLLGTTRVSVYPGAPGGASDIRIRVDIQRFESIPDREAALEAFWTVTPPGGEARSGRSMLRVPVDAPGVDALVAAHRRALERLGEELAGQIRERRTAS